MFNYIDIFFYIFLFILMFLGYSNGLITEIINLLILIIPILITYFFKDILVNYAISNTNYNIYLLKILIPILIYFLVFVILKLIGHFIKKLIKSSELKFINKVLGGFIGIGKGFLFIIIIFIGLNIIPDFKVFAKDSLFQKFYLSIEPHVNFKSLKKVTKKVKLIKKIATAKPEQLKKAVQTEEFNDLMNKKNRKQIIKELQNDKNLKDDIQHKRIDKILKDKRIQKLLEDEELINYFDKYLTDDLKQKIKKAND